jgi:DNA-binding NtrC family response regulator
MTNHTRILAVDDEAMVRFILHDTLQTLGPGYQVVTAQDGREALEDFEKEPFDLVITDVSMPEMNGIQLTEAIRAMGSGAAIIWITAYGCHNVLADAARLGVFTCRDKPLEVDEILRMAREALSGDDCAPSVGFSAAYSASP